MLKKLVLTFFMVGVAFIAQANAQTETTTQISPEKQAAIKELVALMDSGNKAEQLEETFSRQSDSMRPLIIDSILKERTDLTDAEKNSLRESISGKMKDYEDRFRQRLKQKLNYSQMTEEISYIVYDKYYTLDEIKDLIAFYKSPTGQKSLKTMTSLFADVMKLTQERLIPKLQVVMKELEDEEKDDIEREINARKPRPKKPVSK